MEALTILGSIGKTLKVIKDTTETIKWMQEVYENYFNKERTMKLIVLECMIYANSIESIEKWIKDNAESHTQRMPILNTKAAIELVQHSIMTLESDLKKAVNGDDGLSIKVFRHTLEVQGQYFVERMKTHLTELRHTIVTLNLTLSVIQLWVIPPFAVRYMLVLTVGRPQNQKPHPKTPERQDSKTKTLEKRLLLRCFLTRALEIKRDEINAKVEKAQQQRLIKAIEPPSLSTLRSTPSFYQVAQEARRTTLPPPLPPRTDESIYSEEAEESMSYGSSAVKRPPNTSISSGISASNNSNLIQDGGNILLQNEKTQGNAVISTQRGSSPRGKDGHKMSEVDSTFDASNVQSHQSGASASAFGHVPMKTAPQLISEEKDVMPGSSPTSTATPSLASRASTFNSSASTSTGITEAEMEDRRAALSQDQSESDAAKPTRLTRDTRLTREKHAMSQDKVPTIYEDPESMSSVRPKSLTKDDSGSRGLEPLLENESIEAVEDGTAARRSGLEIDALDPEGFPWIVKAARDGDESMLQKLLNSDADIKAVHRVTKRHALSEASFHGHEKLVDLLIREGAPLEHTDAESCTALHHACRRGELAIAKKLLANNAAIDAPGPDRQTPLHLAITVPHQNIVMLLLQRKANVHARDMHQRTALHLSALQGNLTMCTHLLDSGAQIDHREHQSRTALQLACEMGHYELVEMMLDHAKLKPKDLTFHTAFFTAVEHGHVRIAESFFRRGLKLKHFKEDSHKPATLAAKNGNIDMLELMIKHKCNIRDKDGTSWSALHHAAHHGNSQVVERLLVNKDFSGKGTTAKKETPLILAVRGGHFTTAESLLKTSTATLHTADAQGEQPIHHACRNGSLEILNLLIVHGAKLGTSNSLGWYPIHIASAYGHIALMKRLFEEGSHLEEKLGACSIKPAQTHKMVEEGYIAEARCPYLGSRPLHLACEFEHWDIASYLIAQKGADIHAKCSEGWTPLHHAAFNGESAMVLYLVNSGADVHAQTTEGKTPLGLDLRVSGFPIPAAEKHAVSQILKEAMEKTPKKHAMRMPTLRRGKTVEEKNAIVRAATTSLDMMSKPPNPRTMTSPSMACFTTGMSFSPEMLTKTPSVMTPAIQETPPTPFVPPTSMNFGSSRMDSENFDKHNPLGLTNAHGSSDTLSHRTHKSLFDRASSAGLSGIASVDKYSKEGLEKIQKQLEARRRRKHGEGGGENEVNAANDGFVGFVESEGEEGKKGDDGFVDKGYGTGVKSEKTSIVATPVEDSDKYTVGWR